MCVYCKEEFEYTCTHSQENMALLPWYYCRVERDEKMAVLVLNFTVYSLIISYRTGKSTYGKSMKR